MSEQELRHYGVLGMKWGVRKNPVKAYAKASKKKKKLEDRAEAWSQNKQRREKEVASTRKTMESEKRNLDTERAKRDLAGSELANSRKKYGDGSGDLLGIRRSNLNRAQKNFDKAAESYRKQADKTNKAIVDNDDAESRLANSTYRAERASKKSARWNSLMDSTFKDVSPDVIQAGREMFERSRKKR